MEFENYVTKKLKFLEEELNCIRERNLSHIMQRIEHNEDHIRGIDLRTQIFVPKRVNNE